MLTDVELAYIAGFFDGEGSITIHHNCRPSPRGRAPNHTLQASIGNADEAVVKWIHAHFGGSLTYRPRVSPNHKPVFQWIIRAAKALPFLEAIEPFVRMKKKQVAVAIKFQRSKRRRGPFIVSDKVIIWRENQRVAIRELNGRFAGKPFPRREDVERARA